MGKKKEVMGIDEGFLAEISRMSSDQKKAKVAQLEAHKQEAQEWLKTNETILDLKERLKEVEGPTKDSVKAFKNRQKHLIKELRDAGEYRAEQQQKAEQE